MKDLQAKELLTKILIYAIILLPVSILPFHAIDPINTPQLTVMVIAAFIFFGILFSQRKSIEWFKYKVILLTLIIFIFNLLVVFFISGANLGLQFYGTFGRNTGLLTYISLSLILVTTVIISNEISMGRITNGILKVGVIATIYGVIQFVGLDPVPWDNIFSPVIGFLGNPNFQSALLGVCGVIVFTKLFQSGIQISQRISFGILFFLLLFTIVQTDSRQGLLNLLAGISVVVWIYVKEIGKKKITTFYTASMILVGTLVAFGVFNYGPLGEFLYKRSVSARVFYWEAGVKMTLDNPIFGVGLDNYGDWYRRSRTTEAAKEFGPDSVSDVAHNVLLDFSSNGGFPLLLSYLSIIIVTMFSILRVIRRQHKFNLNHASLVGGWVAYQVQSLISINQLSLVFIGWILSGILIGFDYNSSNRYQTTKENMSVKKSHNTLDPKYVLIIFVSGSLGFLVGAQPMMSSVKYRAALESGQVDRIKNSANLIPLEPLRIYQVASVLKDNKFEKEAIEAIEVGLTHFPDSYILWRLLSEIPEIPPSQLTIIKTKLRDLDPNNV